ncbi:hypothetical protein [Streptomyces sp. NPDC015131]|uniref:hypothetical protein n=1 Tax=Streptomyces sp. NPDC015131 TaxID=3364941 RepID=UPI0036FA5CDA
MEDEKQARQLWNDFLAVLMERGWEVCVGDHTVDIVIPGQEGPISDRYVPVHHL